jgi:hypothetical protein
MIRVISYTSCGRKEAGENQIVEGSIQQDRQADHKNAGLNGLSLRVDLS